MVDSSSVDTDIFDSCHLAPYFECTDFNITQLRMLRTAIAKQTIIRFLDRRVLPRVTLQELSSSNPLYCAISGLHGMNSAELPHNALPSFKGDSEMLKSLFRSSCDALSQDLSKARLIHPICPKMAKSPEGCFASSPFNIC